MIVHSESCHEQNVLHAFDGPIHTNTCRESTGRMIVSVRIIVAFTPSVESNRADGEYHKQAVWIVILNTLMLAIHPLKCTYNVTATQERMKQVRVRQTVDVLVDGRNSARRSLTIDSPERKLSHNGAARSESANLAP